MMPVNRRGFLLQAGALVTAAPLATLSAQTPPPLPFRPDKQTGLSEQHWQALLAVQTHLFPAEETSPGARDINATDYLHAVLADPEIDPAERDFIRKGVLQVEAITQDLYKQPFPVAREEQRETVLRQMEKSADGNAWLREMLRYLFEAMLSDPVYGGNPNGIGWKWLRHTPGFPRPPAEKRYFLLDHHPETHQAEQAFVKS